MDDFDREKIHAESLPALYAAGKTDARRGFIRALLLWLPLLACAGCLLGSYLVMPSVQRNIPVTGRDPLIPPTPTPADPDADPEKTQPPVEPAPPGFSYHDKALMQLEACNSSFHDFFVVEQIAIHQPEIASRPEWRADAEQVVQSFQADCEPLGSLPAAPSAYSEVDTWLKLAAGEVGPAVDGFTVMLKDDDKSHMVSVVDHLLNFLEYTQNAEKLIDRLKSRKQI